jgi:GT2 family glycosyltransferase
MDDRPGDLFFGVWGEEEPWVGKLAESNEAWLDTVLSRNVMATCCPVFRRSTLDRVGPFDETIHGCEDWEYWIRCALLGERFRYISAAETLALVRSHATSTSRDMRRMLEGEVRFRVKLGSSLANNDRLRLANFEKGANRLGELNPKDYSRRLLELARANATKRVYLYALLRLVDRKGFVRSSARTIRSFLPGYKGAAQAGEFAPKVDKGRANRETGWRNERS